MAEAEERDPSSEPSVEALIGHSLGGRYELVSVLGHGGMGAVYEAITPGGEPCAVKVILGEQVGRGDARRRFVREARAIRSIDAENVVKILDADTDGTEGHPYIVMELLRGRDLDRLVREKGALEPAPVVRAFLQACKGLAAAHARGIVHRDVKPANLFLHEDARGEVTVKVCDFGVAKRLEGDVGASTANLTQSGGVVGSPMYMSPEQAKSARDIDHRTDVWGIALSLHEALSGERPWKGCTTVGELIVAICTQSMPPLTEVAPWVPAPLALAVEKGLARNPADRWPTIDAFAKALGPFAGDRTALTRDDLAAVPAQARASANPRVVIGDSGNIGGSTAHATTLGTTPASMNVTTARKPRTAMWIGVAALAGIVVTGVAVQLSRSEPPAPTPTASTPPTAPTPAMITAAQPTIEGTTSTVTATATSSAAPSVAPPATTHSTASTKPTASTSTTTTKPTTSATTTAAPPAPSPTTSSTSPKPKDSW